MHRGIFCVCFFLFFFQTVSDWIFFGHDSFWLVCWYHKTWIQALQKSGFRKGIRFALVFLPTTCDSHARFRNFFFWISSQKKHCMWLHVSLPPTNKTWKKETFWVRYQICWTFPFANRDMFVTFMPAVTFFFPSWPTRFLPANHPPGRRNRESANVRGRWAMVVDPVTGIGVELSL